MYFVSARTINVLHYKSLDFVFLNEIINYLHSELRISEWILIVNFVKI